MRKFFTVILILSLVASISCAGALAACTVYFSGDTNVRTGPGLEYPSFDVAPATTFLDFTGYVCYDARGVAWYSVWTGCRDGWVSSRYGTLTDEGPEW